MRRASMNFKLLDHLTTKNVAREHALNCVLDDELRLLGAHLSHCDVAFAAHPAGVEHIALITVLLARDLDLLRVDDDDEIAGVCMRCIDSLVTAAQYIGDFYGDATECFFGGVNHEPILGVV